MNGTRAALFLVGCIGTRLLLAWLAYKLARSKSKWLDALAILAIAIAAGFFYIWINKMRTHGPETFGEPIWWDHLRPVHAALYATFAAMAINEHARQHAWVPLLADVSIGAAAWAHHHVRCETSHNK
jgi:hypothetical protein